MNDSSLGDNPFNRFVLEDTAASWEDFLAWQGKLQGRWCFRGQRDARWLLETSLDRAVRQLWPSQSGTGYGQLDQDIEGQELLFKFQQQAHQYLQSVPASEDIASWFALMQHHGVPTRFLDWTLSPFVGMYFAIEEIPPEQGCALWAVDLDWLEQRANELLAPNTLGDDLRGRAGRVNDLLRRRSGKPAVIRVDPLRLDARMAAQRGVFLCKLYQQATLGQMLTAMVLGKPIIPDHPVLRKLIVYDPSRVDFLKNLQAMNDHRASLFPGLDGFGGSLRLELEIKARTWQGV